MLKRKLQPGLISNTIIKMYGNAIVEEMAAYIVERIETHTLPHHTSISIPFYWQAKINGVSLKKVGEIVKNEIGIDIELKLGDYAYQCKW
jgi:hypothetical protein